MNYLAVSKDTHKISYAYFKDTVLMEYEQFLFDDFGGCKRMLSIYDYIKQVVMTNKIGVVVTHSIDLDRIKKKDLRRIYETRAILQLVCGQTKTVYMEARTNGWERYITNGKTTYNKKRDIINNAYELELETNLSDIRLSMEGVVDAIILGEALAHGRLHEEASVDI
jgi:hypothetical protein